MGFSAAVSCKMPTAGANSFSDFSLFNVIRVLSVVITQIDAACEEWLYAEQEVANWCLRNRGLPQCFP